MKAWIIDDGPLDWLAQSVDPSDLAGWPRDRFFVAAATATAAREDAQHSAAAKRRLALLECQNTAIATFDIQMGSRASEILYTHLRQPAMTSANLAEHQAIAWALEERDEAILVTVDKRAAITALAELGRTRVAHAFDLWIELRERGLISPEQFASLCEATRRGDQGLPGLPIRCQQDVA
jgi:hypothetical protein